MHLPDVPTIASLDARGEIDLDEEARAQLLRAVGDPVGPQGIPRMAAMWAGLAYLGSLSLPVIGPLMEMLLSVLGRRVIAPWLRPLIERRKARNQPPGWVEQQRIVSDLHERLVFNTPFLRFHRRQALVLGLILVAFSVVTCGVGLVLGAVPYLWFGYTAWHQARTGHWYQVPWLGPRLVRPYLDRARSEGAAG